MIYINSINKSFNSEPVIRGIDLDIPESETTVLIGPSGCGKSTLLRMVMGLIQPDSGEITITGKTMNEKNKLLLRRLIGYVIQKGGLFPHLTARENCKLAAEYLKWSSDKIDNKIQELAALTKIDMNMLDRLPKRLSGGQQQRISLIRALMLDPEILLLDEPLGSIDPLVRHELQTDLKEIFKNLNKTVLLVTHDLGEAAYLGDNIVLMNKGEIIQKGTIRELNENPANEFVSKFIQAQRSPLGGSV